MDLVQISKKDYSVGELVEGWTELIWTERYLPNGELELHTQDIEYTMRLLPERSFCSILDSKEVVRIDSHEITDNDDGVPELVVKGRTLDIFPENRVWKNAPYGKSVAMAKKYTARQAAEVWLWNAICNGTGNDRIRTSASYAAANQLPNVIVTDSVPPSSDGAAKARKVQNGDVYSQLQTFLSAGKLGIRIIRPSDTKGRRVDVAGDGTFSTTHLNGITDLRFDIYKGRDLSDKIVFSHKAEHLQDPNYLFSSETMKTGMWVDGDPRDHYYTNPDILVGSNSGWNRLDGYSDGGSKEDGETADDFEESLEDQALREMRKNRRVSAVDAQIAPDIEFVYNRDYRLGDIVTVQGEYGAQDKKYVIEYIRTHNQDGEVGYPTLSSTLS